MVFKKLRQIFDAIFVPTGLDPLKFILLLENMAGIYRNIYSYKEKYRFIIYLRIITDVVIIISSVTIYTVFLLPHAFTNDLLYYYTNTVNSMIIILIASYHSKTFKKLLLLVENNDLYFANDTKYVSDMRKQDKIIKTGVIIFHSMIMLSGFVSTYKRNQPITYVSLKFLFTVNSRVCDFRNVFEYTALYSVLYVISQQVECITREVGKKGESVSIVAEQRDNISDDDLSEMGQGIRDFEELSTVFTNITKCSKLFNQIYGLQLIVMLGTATVYCIMFLYTMTFISMKGFQDIGNVLSSIWKLVVFFLLLLMLSRSAQMKQNNTRNLRRQLGKLIIFCVDNGIEYKATKDFLCLVSAHSVQTKTFGSIDVDMSLIPSFVMFITSYTVIALQFSNIV